MSEGWLLLHRKMQDNGLWKDKPFSKGQAWIDILLSTSYKDSSFWIRGNETKVKGGQLAMSTLTMADRWGWSRGKVRGFLKYLESSQQISQQKSSLTTLITIVNWEEHQIKSQQKEQQKASRKPQSKKVKESKEEPLVQFDDFWNAFNDKRSKEPAKKSWIKLSPDAELRELIIAGAKRYAIERDGILSNNGTPKMAQGWLTDRRWEDETGQDKTQEMNWVK